jgi:hypothetical protein
MMRASLLNRTILATFRRSVLFGMIGAVLTGFMVVNTLTSISLGTSPIKLGNDNFSDDPDLVVSAKRLFNEISIVTAEGTGPPGVEAASGLPRVTNGQSELLFARYLYEFELKEAAANSLQAGENFKIEIYRDDGSSTSLVATLYMKQDTVDDASVEGVTVQAYTGLTDVLGDVFSIVITRQ